MPNKSKKNKRTKNKRIKKNNKIYKDMVQVLNI